MGNRGGKRPGAGHPKTGEKLLAQAKELVQELRGVTRRGLAVATKEFPKLVEAEIEAAYKGETAEERMKARHYLMDLVQKVVQVREVEESPVVAVIERIREERRLEVAGEVREGSFTTLDSTGNGGSDRAGGGAEEGVGGGGPD